MYTVPLIPVVVGRVSVSTWQATEFSPHGKGLPVWWSASVPAGSGRLPLPDSIGTRGQGTRAVFGARGNQTHEQTTGPDRILASGGSLAAPGEAVPGVRVPRRPEPRSA